MKNQEAWDKHVSGNDDPYGKACVDVAREVMNMLDEEDAPPLVNGYAKDNTTAFGLICLADEKAKAGGITGFMAGCVAQMVVQCHERGEEFRKSHNGEEYQGEGVVNHAILTISSK